MFATIIRHGTDDPIQLAKRIGFTLTFKQLPTKVRAMFCRHPGIITINAQMPHAVQRLAVAHIIGHFLKHPYLSFGILSWEDLVRPTQQSDIDATRFAIALLTHCGEYRGYDSPFDFYNQLGYNESEVHQAYKCMREKVLF